MLRRAKPPASVPHPFAFFLAKGWEATNPDRSFLEEAATPLRSGRSLISLGLQKIRGLMAANFNLKKQKCA
jgi:hypothetical protein